MGYIIKMPQMGMSMDEGTVVEWVVDEGETVTADDVIVVVESEKASNDVQAREDGAVRQILVEEGGVVEPGEPIGIFADPDEDVTELEEQVGDGTTAEASDSAGASSADESTSETTGMAEAESVRATPGARKRAEEAGVDLTTVSGSGPGGAITEDDVEDALESAGGEGETATSESATRTVTESTPLSGLQQTISERLSESNRNAVHVTLNREFETDAIDEVLSAAGTLGIDVSLNDVLLKAVAGTLEEHPDFNALYEDGEHRKIEEVNIGVAVDNEAGLLTPVVPDVDEKSLSEVNEARRSLTQRVLNGEYTMDDLEGGTFTISNLGMFGVDHFDPVINPPEIAILGVGRIRDDGRMTLSLSFDHRIVNGADAARFLGTLVEKLTSTETLASYFTDRP